MVYPTWWQGHAKIQKESMRKKAHKHVLSGPENFDQEESRYIDRGPPIVVAKQKRRIAEDSLDARLNKRIRYRP